MKGVMFTQQGVTQIIDEDMPTIGDDQMLLRTRFSGISNGTERSFLMGGPYGGKKWPNRIGYLTVSEVIETGAQITDHAVGDIVYTGTYPGHVALHTARQSDMAIFTLPNADTSSNQLYRNYCGGDMAIFTLQKQ